MIRSFAFGTRNVCTFALLLFETGCFGTPTPLAPGLRGSIGLPSQGVLTLAEELPRRGPGFERYRPYGDRNFGTPGLVSAIRRAAQQVEALSPNSPPLVVGDLSARLGGKISRHASHRSGRDVDFLIYTTTLDQRPIKSPGFVHFGADSLARLPSGRYVALDIRRQWLLVRSLLTDPDIDVLWMFISRDIEAYLIDYAKASGEPVELILRASRALHQPRDSANHDDHMHLRIACSPKERVSGCDSGGPNWPWLSPSTFSEELQLYEPSDSPENDENAYQTSYGTVSSSALTFAERF